MPPDLSLESAAGGTVCGIDEVGRGPLAGPVMAAAVILPRTVPEALHRELDDSKKLTAARRTRLDAIIRACARVGLGRAEVDEIDRLNILEATLLAMRRAVAALPCGPGHGPPPDLALVDGNQDPRLPCAARCVIGGDGRSLSIAAASVVAKVRRDAEMAELARAHPGYGWERNAGYGTLAHREALKRLGPTPHHRRSFAPVAAALQNQVNPSSS